MTASHPIDVEKLLEKQLATASPDLLRSLMSTFIAALMSAEADVLCGAGYSERSPQRSNRRNGYRPPTSGCAPRFRYPRGHLDVATIPKLRGGPRFG